MGASLISLAVPVIQVQWGIRREIFAHRLNGTGCGERLVITSSKNPLIVRAASSSIQHSAGVFNPARKWSSPKEWLPAYQVNVGWPTADASVYHQGKAGCDYTVFGRAYTKGLVLVRPKDFWNCTDYGDTTVTTITLPQPMRPLRGDGTLGPSGITASLRNAEALEL